MSARPSFFAELQRRHVYKVGAMYAVAGWLLVQVITQVFPIYDISAHVQRVFVGVIVAGFPVALVLAWLFDITPAGIVRTEGPPASGESPAAVRERRGTDRKLNYVLSGLLLLAIGYVVLDHRLLGRSADSPAVDTSHDKSIAVLPFENLSDDRANAYFATGIQDEILTRLAKIGALKVISRTSTQHFASSPDNLPEIANKLGVSAILEGSVQRAGETVHVNVQLIRAATDEHVWAESYNRKLDDIFAVQAEIAQAVADALSAKLTGAEKQELAQKPTSNPQAYEAYLRALVYEGRYVNSLNEYQEWAGAYEDAVRLDPNFAQAWAGLSRAYTEWYFGIDTSPKRLGLAKAALDQALRLAPDAVETWDALGLYRYWGLNDYDAAFAAYGEALKRKPNAASVLNSMGNVRRRQGHWEEALALQQRALVLDPLNSLIQFNLTLTYRALRRFDEAQRVVASGLVANPGDPALLSEQLYTEQARGDMHAAHRFAEQVPLTAPDTSVLRRRFEQWIFERDYGRAVAEIGQVLERRTQLGSRRPPSLVDALGVSEILAGKSAEGLQHVSEARQIIEARRAAGDTSVYACMRLARMSAVTGDPEAAERYARLAEEGLAKDAIGLPQALMEHAFVRMLAGDKAGAIALLEKAQLAPMPYGAFPAILRIDPQFDALRGDPAFEKLTLDPAPATKPSTP
jgi:TolB-like protein/Tfp pilus assembly protein PilF